jgi:hypothetical protein
MIWEASTLTISEKDTRWLIFIWTEPKTIVFKRESGITWVQLFLVTVHQ